MNAAMQYWVGHCFDVIHPIYSAQKNYGIPEAWLAGLIYVECSSLNPLAHRFEPGVYQGALKVRNGDHAENFPGFSSGILHQAILKADMTLITFQLPGGPIQVHKGLAELATSYGVGQIMGYHYLNKWGLQPKDFMSLSLEDSVHYTLLFMANGMQWARNYEELLHWHNTGSVNRKTYDPNYVPNAMSAMCAYQDVMKARVSNG